MKKILIFALVFVLGLQLTNAQQTKTLQDSLVLSQKEALTLIKRMYQAKILSKVGKAHFEDMVTSQEPEDLYAEYMEAYRNFGGHFIVALDKETLLKNRPIAVSEILHRLSFIESIYYSSKQSYMGAMGDAKTKKFNAKVKGFCGEFLLKFLEDKPKYIVSLHQKLIEIGVLPTRIKMPFLLEDENTPIVIENYFRSVGMKVFFFENYAKAKEEQIQQLLALKNEGILTASNYDKLIKGYAPYQIYTKIEVLMLCEKAVVIDLENLTNDTNTTANFIENIRISIFPDMQLNIIGTYQDSTTNEYEQKMRGEYLKVIIDRQEYHSPNLSISSTYGMTAGWVVYPPLSAISNQDASSMNIQFFNDYLIDQNSNKRLYEMADRISMEGAEILMKRKAGFILLDTNAIDKIPFFEDVLMLQNIRSVRSNHLKRAEIKEFITQLATLDFIKTPPIDELVIKMIRDEARNYKQILWALPDMIARIDKLETCYECEEEDEGQPSFKQYIQDFARISRQQFLPTEVKETKIGEDAYKLSFVWKGKQYEKMMNRPARFFSHTEGFLEMTTWINEALQEQKATGKFYYMDKYSSDAIYLTPAQYSFLSKYLTFQD